MEMELDELSCAIKAHLLVSSLSSSEKTSTETSTKTSTTDTVTKSNSKAKSNKNKELEEDASKEDKGGTERYDRWSLLDSSKIDYGVGCGNRYNGVNTNINTNINTNTKKNKKGFYITTAINYTNGPAHMGHAYEAATSDCIARYERMKNGAAETYFVTGSDEHGQKIANTAVAESEAKGETILPLDLCNRYVTGFQCLNQRILISNDDYVRTTSERHKATAHKLWNRCAANVDPANENRSDIYLDTYSGWYNVREETFVTDSDAQLAEYKDPVSGLPLKKVEEESYFFRMSRYHDRLLQHIQHDNPDFIKPEHHRNFIVSRLESDALRDLSISRTTFDWGIPVPSGFHSNHVMYVWFDALTNYLTGVDALHANNDHSSNNDISNFWPADVHIIGKDILWFHTVIWPCILMSANLPLPKTVFAHGFVNDKDGKKMSKSLGNVVDPHDVLDSYSVDTFRWYLCKEAPYGGELAFRHSSLEDMHNADLCDTLGNLVHRATNLCQKYCDGVVPDVPPPSPSSPIDFHTVRNAYLQKMDALELEAGASLAIAAFRDVNGYLTEMAPWHMKGEERALDRRIVVRATLEAVYALVHLLVPFIPSGAKSILLKLNTPQAPTLMDLKPDLRNLVPGTKVDVGDVLYTKIISEEEKLNAAEAAKKKAESYAEAQKRKKEKKAKEIAASKAGQKKNASADVDQPEFTKIDIRVGQITKIWNHPEADKLFCEEIDVGEETGPRQIASGLRGHYELADMQNKKVLVVCNLKAAKIVGFVSNGMVLAAKSEDGSKVELVTPPEDAPIGERVFIDGLTGDPFSPAQVKKKKAWESMSKGLKTADGGVATWEGKEIKTSAGVCAAASLVGAPIS